MMKIKVLEVKEVVRPWPLNVISSNFLESGIGDNDCSG